MTFNQVVRGSSPRWLTKNKKNDGDVIFLVLFLGVYMLFIRNILSVSVVLLALALIFCGRELKEKKQIWRLFGLLFLGSWMVCVFTLTGIYYPGNFHFWVDLQRIQYVPFRGIYRMLANGLSLYDVENILGNVILFVPVGILCPLLFRKISKWYTMFLGGLGMSLVIEITQLFIDRGPDVDDLILNTAGMMAGYIIFMVFSKVPFVKEALREDEAPKRWNRLLPIGIAATYLVVIGLGMTDCILDVVWKNVL